MSPKRTGGDVTAARAAVRPGRVLKGAGDVDDAIRVALKGPRLRRLKLMGRDLAKRLEAAQPTSKAHTQAVVDAWAQFHASQGPIL